MQLACGHWWPGQALDRADAESFLALCVITGDTARCLTCGTQQLITGPLRDDRDLV